MVFGSPPKGPYGNPFTSTRKASDAPSGLYGMPPVPQIGEPPPFSASVKKSTGEEPKPFNLFGAPPVSSSSDQAQGIFSTSTTTTANIFGKPATPIFTKPTPSIVREKPDLFKSIKSATEEKNTKPGQQTLQPKNPFQVMSNQTAFPVKSGDENIFKPSVSKNPFGSVSESVSRSEPPKTNPFLKRPLFSQKDTATNVDEDKIPRHAISGSLKSRLGQKPIEVPTTEETDENQEDEYFEDDQEESEENDAPLSSKPPNKKLERLTSKEELKAIKSIVCEQIPQPALNKKVLEKHFSKFGKVHKIVLNTKKLMATVHFEDHKSARKAKEKGLTINPQIPKIGAIFYSKIRKSFERTELEDELASLTEAAPEEFKVDPTPLFRRPPKVKKQVMKSAVTSKPELTQTEQIQQVNETRTNMNERELLERLRSQAFNESDRYEILDARDKLMRLRAPPKAGDVILRGCCPDICPERERYSRAIKNQLRFYEKLNGDVNHQATLKEYARSAADQDVALLHELRPSNVLNVAMNHLLCNVIDRIEIMKGSMEEWYDHVVNGHDYDPEDETQYDNTGEWFEFLWSTTRAIRKDITQQDLNKDPVAVDLIEKCARFHIMCAERLVEEDINNFSKKLNDENLTKCITTLKHMYYDMSMEGQECPNEAEFRSYDVLLNLNQGDTLRSIQTLALEVRTSPEIKFAMKVLTAVNTNNYVKFFKLVRESTLLQGCLLLRYFSQVRKKALETMVRAYCPKLKGVIQYRLSKMTDLLAFENDLECARFCERHGLGAETDSDMIYMEKVAFYFPENPLESTRARNLIESKRETPWSIVINGNYPLPQNPYLTYEPHDSFDENGFLKPEAYEAHDQQSFKSESVVAPPLTQQVPSSFENQQEIDAKRELQRAVVSISDDILLEVVRDECIHMGQDSMKQIEIHKSTLKCSDLLHNEVLGELLYDISKEVIKELRNEELQSRLAQEAEFEAAEEIRDEVIDELTNAISEEVAKQEMKTVSQTLALFSEAPKVVEEVCNNVIAELSRPIATKVLEECHQEREDRVNEIRNRQTRRTKYSTFRSWRKYVSKRKSQRSILDDFPCIPKSKTLGKSSIRPTSFRNTLQTRRQVDQLHEVIDLEESFLEQTILEPMNVLPDVLQASHITHWKLIVCTPTLDSSDSIGKGLVEMVKKKLSINPAALADQDYDFNVLTCFSAPKISMTARWIDSQMIEEDIAYSDKKRREYLTGTSAILFLYIEEEESIDQAQKRLNNLVHNIPEIPGVAVMILTTSRRISLDLVELFDLQKYVEEKLITSFDIISTNVDIFKISTVLSVHTAISTASKMSKNFDSDDIDELNVKIVRDYVEDFLVDKFFNTVYTDLADRRSKRWPHRNPDDLVYFYNCVIDHLIQVCSSKELEKISWPIPELKRLVLDDEIPSYWNEYAYMEQVLKWIDGLKLPQFYQKEDLNMYLGRIKRSSSDFTLAVSRINYFLGRRRIKQDTPWTDIIHCLIDFKLGHIPTTDPFSTSGSDMIVVYFKRALEEFKFPDTWIKLSIQKPAQDLNNQKQEFMLKEISNNHVKNASGSSEFHQNLRAELDSSLNFEKVLQSMVSGDYTVVKDNPVSSQESNQDDDNDNSGIQYRSIHVPVVSMLSPSLGLIAGCRARKHRIDFGIESPVISSKKRSRPHPALKENQDDDDLCLQKTKKTIKSHLVKALDESIERELNSSKVFEQKLLDAQN